ncbi:MAG: heme ABC transporter substrate-binding protein IsdE [Solibacillus sp.]
MKQSKSYIYVIGFLLMILMLVGCGKTEETAPVSADEVMEADEAPSELRLVTTTAAVTKIFEELDLDLVGVPTTIQTLAARYDDAVRVGNPMGPDVEIIASLKPTEVFSVTTLEYDLKESFESLNIPATYVNLQGLQQMKDSILDIGNRYDRAARAQEIVDTMDKEIAALQKSVEGKEKPKVLILLGIPGSYLVATENSYIGDLVRLAGGENIAAGQAAEYLPSNTEFLHQSNPDIIIRLAHGMPEEVVKMFKEEFKTNDIWKHFNAVQNDRVYDLEEPLFGTTATMDVTTALTQLIDTMYGEQE